MVLLGRLTAAEEDLGNRTGSETPGLLLRSLVIYREALSFAEKPDLALRNKYFRGSNEVDQTKPSGLIPNEPDFAFNCRVTCHGAPDIPCSPSDLQTQLSFCED